METASVTRSMLWILKQVNLRWCRQDMGQPPAAILNIPKQKISSMPPPTSGQNPAQKSLTLVGAMCGNCIQTLIFSKQT